MTPDHDVLIAGGGPAGLAAAIHAAERGLEPVVFEPRESPIDKACGEGLMPAALGVLEQLGVAGIEGHPFRGIRYLDARDPDVTATGEFPAGPGRGVRRTTLHAGLSERVNALGIERVSARVRHVERRDSHVEAEGRTGRFLIVADGLNSKLRRRLGLDRPMSGPRRYGVRRHFEVAPWADWVEVYWSDDGEAYVTPVDAELLGVAILSEGGGRFDELFQSFPHLQQRLDGVSIVSEDRGAGPFLQSAKRVVDGRVLLVGDAAGYVDALTGEGVALAAHTATAAVDAIASGNPDAYRDRWADITRAYRWLTRGLVGLAGMPVLHRPMIRTLDAWPGLFDSCLALLGGNSR